MYSQTFDGGFVKKCASCSKDLPEAALHCVFCGAKQAPAPAVQPGLAKTAFGYSPEMMEQLKQSGGQAPAPAPYQPPPQQQRSGPSQPPPYQAPPQQRSGPSQPPPMQGYPQGGLAPAAHPSAATVFVPGGGPPQMQPQMQPMQPAPAYQPVPVNNPGGMGVHSPQQLTPQPLPQVPQAYLGAQAAQRAGRPIEPWKDALPFMMIVWGVALLAAFAAPVSTSPLAFNWDAIIHGEGTAKVPMLVIAAVGLVGLIVGVIPMMPLPRGILAAVLGLAGILVPILIVAIPPWQILLQLAGGILLVPGLFVRNEYTESLLSRVLVTLGVICVLLPYLLPSGGEIPLVGIFKGLIDAPGQGKVPFILMLGQIVLVVLALLVWMPGPATAGAKMFAWLLILYPVVAHFVGLLLAGHLGDVIKASPYTSVASWVPEATCTVFIGYGMATVFGKQLE